MKFVKFVESRHLPLSLLVVEIFCKKRTICLYGIMIDYNCERKKKKKAYILFLITWKTHGTRLTSISPYREFCHTH